MMMAWPQSTASNDHRMRALGAVTPTDLPDEGDSLHVMEIIAQ
jgi:hypothetical protein